MTNNLKSKNFPSNRTQIDWVLFDKANYYGRSNKSRWNKCTKVRFQIQVIYKLDNHCFVSFSSFNSFCVYRSNIPQAVFWYFHNFLLLHIWNQSSRQFYLNFVLLKNMFILRLPWFWIHIVCKLHSYFLRSALNCHNFVWKLIGPWLVRVYHLSLAYTFYSCSKFNLDYGVEPLMRPAVCFHHYIFVFLYFGFWSILLFVPFELSISNTNDW